MDAGSLDIVCTGCGRGTEWARKGQLPLCKKCAPRRAAACLKACEGISVESLESGELDELFESARGYSAALDKKRKTLSQIPPETRPYYEVFDGDPAMPICKNCGGAKRRTMLGQSLEPLHVVPCPVGHLEEVLAEKRKEDA